MNDLSRETKITRRLAREELARGWEEDSFVDAETLMAREKRIQLTRDLAYKLVETAPKTYWSEFSQSLYLARASIDKPTGLTRGNHVAT